MRFFRMFIRVSVIAVVVLVFTHPHSASASNTSYSLNQTCGTTLYTASLTLNTSGSTPAYDFTYSVNGVNGAPSTQTFEYNVYVQTAGFADKLVAACNGQDDLGIFILDTPAAPPGGIFDSLAAIIGYRNSVTPIILESDGIMKYGSSDIQTEIVRRTTRAMMSQNAKTIAARADGDTFFVFFGNPFEVQYVKLEYYKTALGHTYLVNDSDPVYFDKPSGCEILQPFTIHSFSPSVVLTVPVIETTKVLFPNNPAYPDGYGCKGSSFTSFSREHAFSYDATTKKYTKVSSKRIPEIGGVTVVNGVWAPTESTTVNPIEGYQGAVFAKKAYLGYEDGSRFMFVPKNRNSNGAFMVYDGTGAAVATVKPFGASGKKGFTADATASGGIFFLAVGQKGGAGAKVYGITSVGVRKLSSLTAGKGNGPVTVKFLKLYGDRYGLVTLTKVDGQNVVKVWKYSPLKNVFTADRSFKISKIKIRGSTVSLR